MIVLGLTGSIGMGKSATAALFRELSIPVYDADAFPGVIRDGRVDRTALRDRVLNDKEALKRLESIVHPLVGQTQIDFRAEAEAAGAHIVVLDVPLLFETGGDKRVDYIVVVTAPSETQRQRVLSRPGMTEESFQAILEKQTPDAEKRARADFIINTRIDIDYAREQVTALVSAMKRMIEE